MPNLKCLVILSFNCHLVLFFCRTKSFFFFFCLPRLNCFRTENYDLCLMEPIKASMTVQILLQWVLDGGLQQLRVRTILFTDKKYSMV